MTVFDVRCDLCGTALLGPALQPDPMGPYGVRFVYHPGDPARRDDSGLLCGDCWAQTREWLGDVRGVGRCARCGTAEEFDHSLHVQGGGDLLWWQLCKADAVAFLNRLRTVEPKLEIGSFTLAGDWDSR